MRIPLQTLDSTFAQVVGVDEFEHSAYAMAAIEGEGFFLVETPEGVRA